MSKHTTRVLLVLATALSAALLTAGLPAAQAEQADLFPGGATRVATEDDYLPDILTSLGLKPIASVSDVGSTPSGWMRSFEPFSKGVESLGNIAGSTSNLEALAATAPQAIIAPYSLEASVGPELHAIAPTIYYDTNSSLPQVNPDGTIASDWKLWLYQVASQIGRMAQADRVVANLANRADAIKGQLAGETLGYIRLESPSTWNTGNDYLPVIQVYVQDLGINNVELPSSDYAASCALTSAPLTQPPAGCQSSVLSNETLTLMGGADAIVVQVGAFDGSDISTFETNPLYTQLQAVTANHVSQGQFFTRLGPLGVAYEYDAIESAFGIKEYYSDLGRKPETRASITLNPSTAKLCWSVEPPNGPSTPSGSLTLSIGDRPASTTLTLAAAPQYTTLPSSEESVNIPTPTWTQSITTGCMTAPQAIARDITKSPSSFRVHLGSIQGILHHGTPSIIATGVSE